MARTEVVYVRCDRCKREELQPVGPPKGRPDFIMRLDDKELVYNDLCPRCKTAILSGWGHMEEWERGINPVFAGPAVMGEKAPPLSPPPDNTPPKPHSLAASHKR